MQVGQRAKVIKLERPTQEDRSAYVDQVGLLVRRLNAPWTPDYGSLWELRFDDGEQVVFSESEVAIEVADGSFSPLDMDDLRESWGDAPLKPSVPFRRFGAGTGGAPALLALLVFGIAGVLLIWAGVVESSLLLGAAGALLVLIGVAATAVLVS